MKTMMEKAGECIQDTVKDVADAVTGKLTRKRRRQCAKRRASMVCGGFMLFAAGCLTGIHRTVVRSLILEEKMPKAPSWHFWCH